MAADIKLKPSATMSIITTGMDSLTDTSRAISGDFDNSANLDPFADLELDIAYTSSAPVAGLKVAEVYLLPSVDGSNYAEGSASITPQKALLVATFESRNGSTSTVELLSTPGISLPPDHMKFLVVNTSGKTLKSSGNILKIRPYKYQST